MSRCSRVTSGPISESGSHPVADLHLRDPLLDRVDERVGDVADRDDHRDRHAALARRAVAGGDGRVGGHVDVGVGQHDHVVLRAAERLARACRASCRSRRRSSRSASSRRTRPRRRRGASSSASTATLSPWIDVEDAVRDARLGEQLGDVDRRGRVLLGRLEDERVPARERGRPHPHGHHRGEVERRDPGDDAERLADRVDVDAGRGLLGELALEQRRDAAAELDHLEPARDLAHRVGEDLAVLGGEEAREVVAVLVDELADAEEELGAARERERAPGGEGAPRGLDGGVDLLDGREVDGARLLAGRGVVDRAAAARLAGARACRRSSG